MSVDHAETLDVQGAHRRHGRPRKRSLSRRWRKSTAARRFGRGIGIFFLGLVIVAASLFFAQRFTDYRPPASAAE